MIFGKNSLRYDVAEFDRQLIDDTTIIYFDFGAIFKLDKWRYALCVGFLDWICCDLNRICGDFGIRKRRCLDFVTRVIVSRVRATVMMFGDLFYFILFEHK
jgi:hypothetical protein